MSSVEIGGESIGKIERLLDLARQGESSQIGTLLNLYRGYLLTFAANSLGPWIDTELVSCPSRRLS